jgi:uncharacterized protein (DUF2141 family)
MVCLLAASGVGPTASGAHACADADATGSTATLVVELHGMTSDAGAVVYAVWRGPEGWLEDGAVREGSVSVAGGAGTIKLDGLPYGEYAVSVYHDRNGNGRLDTGLFHIPKEPIGTSNDAKIRFGPPRYEDAAFLIDRPAVSIAIGVHKIF